MSAMVCEEAADFASWPSENSSAKNGAMESAVLHWLGLGQKNADDTRIIYSGLFCTIIYRSLFAETDV